MKTETSIPENDAGNGGSVPVLMGGGLPFTNMENLETENYEDGTYYYEEILPRMV